MVHIIYYISEILICAIESNNSRHKIAIKRRKNKNKDHFTDRLKVETLNIYFALKIKHSTQNTGA